MNTNKKKIIQGVFLGTMLFVSSFSFALAAVDQNYTVLSPLPGTTINPNCTGTDCKATLFGDNGYLQGIFNLMIGVGAVSAFVVITIYGFEYMFKDTPAGKQNAKEWIVNALWGLGFVIFAYAILNTLGSQFVRGTFSLPTPTPSATVVVGGANGAVGRINTCADQTSALCQSEKVNRTTLAANQNIRVQAGCQTPTQTAECTNLANVNTNAIQDTVALQRACGCSLSITGGTEHHPTNMLDMSADSGLNTFLTGSTNVNISTLTAPITKTINGQTITFTYESAGQETPLITGGSVTATGNHWHVIFPR